MASSPIILIDCYGIFYRAFYAFSNNPLTNSKGQETAVIYGFFTTLYKIISERRHNKLICILDSKGKTFRHELYKEYKANRPPMADSLAIQINVTVEAIIHLGIPVVNVSTLEADDLIAYYVHHAKENRIPVEIISHDKDLMQLVGEGVQLVQLDRNQQGFVEYREAEVKEKYGVAPKQIVDYLALVGDSSDNVPGVAGIGDKSATKLLEEYGSLEQIYQVIGDVPPRYAKKLQDNRDNAFLSRQLVDLQNQTTTIEKAKQKEIPNLDELEYNPCDLMAVREVWEEYECRSLMKKYGLNNSTLEVEGAKTILDIINHNQRVVPKNQNHTQAPSPTISSDALPFKPFSRTTLTPTTWMKVIKKIEQKKEVVFDLETTSIVPFDADIVSVVMVVDDESYYFPLISNPSETSVTPPHNYEAKWLSDFRGVLESPKIKKIGHNLKFEYTILHIKGITLAGITHDTMIYEYLVDPDRNAFKLSDLVLRYFQIEKPSYQQMAKGYADIYAIPDEVLAEYTFQDGEYTYRIYQEQMKRSLPEKSTELFYQLELPLLVVLAKMELAGVLVNAKHLKKIEKLLTQSLGFLEQEIYRLAGEEFNINSTKKLQDILFVKLGIDPIKKTKTGLSTDNYVLERLARYYPIADSLVSYRKTTKLLSTYVLTLPELIHPKTKRIHTNYNQSVAATGRLSSTNPNLQNIPVGEDSQGIRHAFIAPLGADIVKIDYSQVELRVVAYLAQDERLLTAYKNNEDIHRLTAHLIFAKPQKEVTPEERNIAKTINFSVIYGISPFSLSEDLGVTREDAKQFIESYFANYSGVRDYQAQILKDARKNMSVETYYGRKRMIREINASNFNYRSRAERIAFNTVIQGTASDIIKKAMVNIDAKLGGTPGFEMIMQVHDELVFYIEEDLTEKLIPILEQELTNIKPFDKLLTVNTKISKHWS